mgnify:CR=1 FL=1
MRIRAWALCLGTMGALVGCSSAPASTPAPSTPPPVVVQGLETSPTQATGKPTHAGTLSGKTVVAKTGAEGLTFAQSIADQYGFTVKALDKADTMYSEVATGNAAAVFDDYPVLAYGINQGNGLKIVTPKEQGSSYGFAVLKGSNPELLQAFNAGLTAAGCSIA